MDILLIRLIATSFSVIVLWFLYDPKFDGCNLSHDRDVVHCLLDRAYNESYSVINGELPNDQKQASSKGEKAL